MSIALWVVQGLLALMFGFAGGSKAFQPMDAVKKSFPWANDVPAGLVRFIGACEVLGAIGLILPGVTRVLPGLTVAAASGLALIMIFAAVFHASRRELSSSGVNAVLLLLALFVVVGRLAWAPL